VSFLETPLGGGLGRGLVADVGFAVAAIVVGVVLGGGSGTLSSGSVAVSFSEMPLGGGSCRGLAVDAGFASTTMAVGTA